MGKIFYPERADSCGGSWWPWPCCLLLITRFAKNMCLGSTTRVEEYRMRKIGLGEVANAAEEWKACRRREVKYRHVQDESG